MTVSSLSESSDYSAHPLHSAISGKSGIARFDLTQTILVCPLPLSGLAHAELLPELSHELKTPLAGIIGLAQVLQHQSSIATNREHQYADLIYQKSQQLLVAINDLFDLAQMSTRQFVLQLRPVNLASILNTALQTSQQIKTDLEKLQLNSILQEDKDNEAWIVGDQSRLEQLFTHLIGYLLSQNLLQQNLSIFVNLHSNWLAVTIRAPYLQISDSEQGYLNLPYQSSEPNTTTMIPGRSSAVLKFVLAQQLAHLQGGDITWISDQDLGTDVTVILPQDLSRTTDLAQGQESIHVCLILSQQAEVIRALAGLLQAQGALVIVGRSLDEAQEKSTILSPTVVMLDDQYASACDESLLIHWLTHSVGLHQATLIGLDSVPVLIANSWPDPIEVWTWPLSEEKVHVTLAKLLQPDHLSVIDKSPIQISESIDGRPNSSQSMVLLQFDLSPGLQAPEPIVLEILTHLTRDYGCSMLTVNDAEQAMLLARIWRPKVLICPGTIPSWIIQLAQNPDLNQLPFVVLGVADSLSVHARSNAFPWIIPYPVAAELDALALKAVTHHLYQQLLQLAEEGGKERYINCID